MASELLLDTSGLVSILDRSQRHHLACVATFESWKRPVLTTEAVLTEATHLLGRVAEGPMACLRFILQGGAVLVPTSVDALARAEQLMRKYAGLPLDYADATLVVLAEETSNGNILTLDRRGFTAVRWGRSRAFEVHPEI